MAANSGGHVRAWLAGALREPRPVVAYLTGLAFVATGIMLRCVGLICTGGAVVIAGIFYPLARDAVESHRRRPTRLAPESEQYLDLTGASDPELTAIVHRRIAELEELLDGYTTRHEAFMNVIAGASDQVVQAVTLLRERP